MVKVSPKGKPISGVVVDHAFLCFSCLYRTVPI